MSARTRTEPPPGPQAPGRGRPRSSTADAAILDATRDLLAESGWGALSVEAVAARAGVAKTTVYRRFSSRYDLAMAVLGEVVQASAAKAEETNDPRELLRAAVLSCAAAYRRPAARTAMLAVLAEAQRDERLRAAVKEQIEEPGRRLVIDGVALALEQGHGHPDAAAAAAGSDLLYDLITGTVLHRLVIRGEEADDVFVEQLADAALAVLGEPMGTAARGGAGRARQRK
ncbi:MAG: TetR/AcrR family transcriptional regulator [Candidatus Nanopelagicales bacterium]|jgi:AcrR family transcriptional regulator